MNFFNNNSNISHINVILGLKTALINAQNERIRMEQVFTSNYMKSVRKEVVAMQKQAELLKIKNELEKDLKDIQEELENVKKQLEEKENENVNLNFKVNELNAFLEEKTEQLEDLIEKTNLEKKIKMSAARQKNKGVDRNTSICPDHSPNKKITIPGLCMNPRQKNKNIDNSTSTSKNSPIKNITNFQSYGSVPITITVGKLFDKKDESNSVLFQCNNILNNSSEILSHKSPVVKKNENENIQNTSAVIIKKTIENNLEDNLAGLETDSIIDNSLSVPSDSLFIEKNTSNCVENFSTEVKDGRETRERKAKSISPLYAKANNRTSSNKKRKLEFVQPVCNIEYFNEQFLNSTVYSVLNEMEETRKKTMDFESLKNFVDTSDFSDGKILNTEDKVNNNINIINVLSNSKYIISNNSSPNQLSDSLEQDELTSETENSLFDDDESVLLINENNKISDCEMKISSANVNSDINSASKKIDKTVNNMFNTRLSQENIFTSKNKIHDSKIENNDFEYQHTKNIELQKHSESTKKREMFENCNMHPSLNTNIFNTNNISDNSKIKPKLCNHKNSENVTSQVVSEFKVVREIYDKQPVLKENIYGVTNKMNKLESKIDNNEKSLNSKNVKAQTLFESKEKNINVQQMFNAETPLNANIYSSFNEINGSKTNISDDKCLNSRDMNVKIPSDHKEKDKFVTKIANNQPPSNNNVLKAPPNIYGTSMQRIKKLLRQRNIVNKNTVKQSKLVDCGIKQINGFSETMCEYKKVLRTVECNVENNVLNGMCNATNQKNVLKTLSNTTDKITLNNATLNTYDGTKGLSAKISFTEKKISNNAVCNQLNNSNKKDIIEKNLTNSVNLIQLNYDTIEETNKFNLTNTVLPNCNRENTISDILEEIDDLNKKTEKSHNEFMYFLNNDEEPEAPKKITVLNMMPLDDHEFVQQLSKSEEVEILEGISISNKSRNCVESMPLLNMSKYNYDIEKDTVRVSPCESIFDEKYDSEDCENLLIVENEVVNEIPSETIDNEINVSRADSNCDSSNKITNLSVFDSDDQAFSTILNKYVDGNLLHNSTPTIEMKTGIEMSDITSILNNEEPVIPNFYVEEDTIVNNVDAPMYQEPIDDVWDKIKTLKDKKVNSDAIPVIDESIPCLKSVVHVAFYYNDDPTERNIDGRNTTQEIFKIEEVKEKIKIFCKDKNKNWDFALSRFLTTEANCQTIVKAMIDLVIQKVEQNNLRNVSLESLVELSFEIENKLFKGYTGMLKTNLKSMLFANDWGKSQFKASCLIELTKFYTLLSKIVDNIESIKSLLYDSLYSLKYSAHAVAFGILKTWPHVFTRFEYANSFIIQIMLFTLLNHKMKVNSNVYKIKEVQVWIEKFYQVKLGVKAAEDYVKEAMIKFDNDDWIDAVVLLCKRQFFYWTWTNVIMKYFVPILKKWHNENFHEYIVLKILVTIQKLMRHYKRENETKNLYNFNSLVEILADLLLKCEKGSRQLKELLVYVLCSLSYLEFSSCSKILNAWKPTGNEVSVDLIKKLHSYMMSCDINFQNWFKFVAPQDFSAWSKGYRRNILGSMYFPRKLFFKNKNALRISNSNNEIISRNKSTENVNLYKNKSNFNGNNLNVTNNNETIKRGRGRPPNIKNISEIKRGRGRPPKNADSTRNRRRRKRKKKKS